MLVSKVPSSYLSVGDLADTNLVALDISIHCDKPFNFSKSIKVLVDNDPKEVTFTSAKGEPARWSPDLIM